MVRMSDPIDDPLGPTAEAPSSESPVQRALRLKKAAIEAREKPPRGGRFQREQAARIATGKSKPWMSR
ncbi:MAG: hypothetical protein RL093_1461 [Pseudomonadota bacterium]|jgi:hypothetical protein